MFMSYYKSYPGVIDTHKGYGERISIVRISKYLNISVEEVVEKISLATRENPFVIKYEGYEDLCLFGIPD